MIMKYHFVADIRSAQQIYILVPRKLSLDLKRKLSEKKSFMISLAIEDNLCHVYLTSEPRLEYWISFPGSLNRNSLVKLGEGSKSQIIQYWS